MNASSYRIVRVCVALGCLGVIVGMVCFPYTWRACQYRGVRQAILAGDESTAIREVLALARRPAFAPDWTPCRAKVELWRRLHLPSFGPVADGYRDPDSITLLQYAAAHGQARLVKALLAAGASVDFYGDHGFQVLVDAAIGGDTRLIAAVIDAGADVNTKWRGTPFIHIVCMSGRLVSPRVIQFLIQAGARPNVRNPGGYTALDIATIYSTNLVPLLLENGAVAGNGGKVAGK